jgi:hypothetical protein
MKFKKHTAFMIDFISGFINGDLERYFFDLDYSAYVIEHFPKMERENARFAQRFADTVDRAYEHGTDFNLSDETFKDEISKALDELLSGNKISLL